MKGVFLEQLTYYLKKLILPSTFVTIKMVLGTMVIGIITGFILAIFLTLYGPNGLNPRKRIYTVLNFLVNTIRSFPILILIVAISPITRMLVGTTIGEGPSSFPFYCGNRVCARLLENSFVLWINN